MLRMGQEAPINIEWVSRSSIQLIRRMRKNGSACDHPFGEGPSQASKPSRERES